MGGTLEYYYVYNVVPQFHLSRRFHTALFGTTTCSVDRLSHSFLKASLNVANPGLGFCWFTKLPKIPDKGPLNSSNCMNAVSSWFVLLAEKVK